MDAEVLKQSAHLLLKGITNCIEGPADLRCEMANSPDFWSVLRILHTAPDAAASVFAVITYLVSMPSAITADNYEALITMLNDFATAGSVGASAEQQQNQKDRRKKGSRPKTQYEDFRLPL